MAMPSDAQKFIQARDVLLNAQSYEQTMKNFA
jgi:hypothetical protein